MNNGQEALGSECPKKQALLALPVVDKLAAYRAVHALRSFPQIVNLQWGPVFAEAVGKHPVGALHTTQIDDCASVSLHAADTLDGYGIVRVILYFGFDDAKIP